MNHICQSNPIMAQPTLIKHPTYNHLHPDTIPALGVPVNHWRQTNAINYLFEYSSIFILPFYLKLQKYIKCHQDVGV